MNRRIRHPGEIGCAGQGVRLDKGRARGIPCGEPITAFRIFSGHTVAKNPCDLDILRVGAKQSVIGGKNLQHAEHEAVISAGKAKACALIATDIHEQLGAWRTAANQFGKFGEMVLGRDNEVKAEIDSRACLGYLAKLIKHRKIGIGAHHIGYKARDAANCRCCGLALRIFGLAGTGDIHTMTEMDMRIHRPRQNCQSGNIDIVTRRAGACVGNGGNLTIGDQDIAGLQTHAGQKGNAAPEGKIRVIGHSLTPVATCAA